MLRGNVVSLIKLPTCFRLYLFEVRLPTGVMNCCLTMELPVGNSNIRESKLEWPCLDDPLWKLDSYSLKPLTPPPHHTAESDDLEYQDYALVITGDVFRWMINHAALETLQRVRDNDPFQLISDLR